MRGKQAYGVPDEENPEWTAADFRNAKSFEEVFPPEIVAAIKRGRGPQQAPTKELVSIRLDGPVLEKWRATGRGWQSRINATLAAHAPHAKTVRKTGRRPPRAAKQSR